MVTNYETDTHSDDVNTHATAAISSSIFNVFPSDNGMLSASHQTTSKRQNKTAA